MADALQALKKEHAEIQKQLKGFDELRDREQRLARAIDVLQGKRPTRVGAGGKRRTSKKQTNRREKLLKALRRADDGLNAREAHRQLGEGAYPTVAKDLKELEAEGKVRRDGQRYKVAS